MARKNATSLGIICIGVSLGLGSGCGAGAPQLQGKAGLLGEAGVARACEEAARDHLAPFVVQWDATELATFEARAAANTIFVRYQGCDLEVLYDCVNPAERGALGAYGKPHFTSGSTQGFDIKNEGELYAKLPLSAVNLSASVSAGESLSLEYYVAGVATNTRDQVYSKQLAPFTGCRKATHFVHAFNLGAFELKSSEHTKVEGGVSVGNLGTGAKAGREKKSLGRGGDLKSCETQDQRACRTPIRLTLRPISSGKPPEGSGSAGSITGDSPTGSAVQSAELALAAAREKLKARDGQACLNKLNQAVGYQPQWNTREKVREIRALCMMLNSQCDEGSKAYREYLAARDIKREMSDELLDKKTRGVANDYCSATQAKNDADRVMRLIRDLRAAHKAKDVKQCQAKLAAIKGPLKRLDKSNPGFTSYEKRALDRGGSAFNEASFCYAAAGQCAASKKAFLDQYRFQGTPGVDTKTLLPAWKSMLKAMKLKCP